MFRPMGDKKTLLVSVDGTTFILSVASACCGRVYHSDYIRSVHEVHAFLK